MTDAAHYPKCPTPEKTRFQSAAIAKDEATVRGWVGGSVYACQGCGGWHITSRMPQGKFRKPFTGR